MPVSVCLSCEHKAYCSVGIHQPQNNVVINKCSSFMWKETQTNANKIRAMTDEELARFINFTTCCANCPAKRSCPENYAMPDKCVSSLLSWLKQEAET